MGTSESSIQAAPDAATRTRDSAANTSPGRDNLRPWRRLISAGIPANSTPEQAACLRLLNAVLLVGVLLNAFGVVLSLLTAVDAAALLLGAAAGQMLFAYFLAVRGHHLLAKVLALALSSATLLGMRYVMGLGMAEPYFLVLMCAAFLIFDQRESRCVYGLVGLALVAQMVCFLPLWPEPLVRGTVLLLWRISSVVLATLLVAMALFQWFKTRHRTLEQLAQAASMAESASRAKSEFLANMSHEIRTPMSGVLGMLAVLMDSSLTAEQREHAETARSSGMALLDLINDILDLAKVEAGEIALEPAPFDLRSTIGDVMDHFAITASHKHIELIVRYVPDTPSRVLGDAARIRQVLINLVGNAIKFTSQGHVLVTIEPLQRPDAAPFIKIAVEDTGPGIPADQQELVFEKFRQVDGSSTRTHGGTGLGLAIARELVRRMGGEIGLSSVPGEGTTFWFTLPLELDAASEPDLQPGLPQLRLLVVEDHPVSRWVLREQLTSWGIRAEASSAGRAALAVMERAQARGAPYDLVLMDYQMPEMDGLMLAHAIRANPALSHTVLVLLASVVQRAHPRELEAAGMAGYLVKPVHAPDLLQVLTAAWSMRERPGEAPQLAQTARRQRSEGLAGAPSYQHTRVLVVEDNPVNQKVAMRLLSRLGCQVDTAGNGREAVEKVAAVAYNLVLMDVQMPEMDGFEATAAIRALPGQGQVPIVAMTARAMVGDRERCLAAGMDGYISKPVMREDLMRTLGTFASPSEDAREPASAS